MPDLIATGIPVAAPPPVIAPSAPPPVWHSTLEPDIVAHAQNRSWDLSDPAKAFSTAAKAYIAAEGRLGVPPDQLLRLPADANDEAGWKALHQRLGAPADAKDYAFDGIDLGDADTTAQFTDAFRRAAAANGLSVAAAKSVAQEVFKAFEAIGAAEEATTAGALETERAALKTNWGSNLEANLFVARQAAAKLGVDPAAVAALENAVGYAKVMEMFRSLGASMGEDRFVAGNNPQNNGVMSRDQALARRFELTGIDAQGRMDIRRGDREWIKRYNNNGAAEVREMNALNVLIAGG